MSKESQVSNIKHPFDLEERTSAFGEAVIDFVKTIAQTAITLPLISQVVRSATSIGANYMEADTYVTKKDFTFKITICRKESKETMRWFGIIAKALPEKKTECIKLWKEAKELVLIFSPILQK